MSIDVDNYLAHLGVNVDSELKHFGKKGMKWGVRNDTKSKSGGSGGAWSADQKKKLKTVAAVAGVAAVAVGAAYVASRYYSNGGDARLLASARNGVARAGFKSTPKTPSFSSMVPKGMFDDVVGSRAAGTATSRARTAATQAAGKKAAETVIKAKGATKIPMDPALKKFVADAPARILADQRGWAAQLGKSLTSVQQEDAAFMIDHIKNFAPKAIGR